MLCPLLKFLDKNYEDPDQIKFQLEINNDNSKFAEKLGIPKELNKKIMPYDFQPVWPQPQKRRSRSLGGSNRWEELELVRKQRARDEEK